MPYDADGTVVAYGNAGLAGGITSYPTGTQTQNLQDYSDHGIVLPGASSYNNDPVVWFFFPGESREVDGVYLGYTNQVGSSDSFSSIQGSNDTTNGVDGTWETAALGSGHNAAGDISIDAWRAHIYPVSFSGPKKAVRIVLAASPAAGAGIHLIHWYGQKASGQTPDDILFIDSDEGTAEYSTVEDFGDRPLGTSVVRQFKVKNGSATKTANSINIQCNDSDFIISTDGVTWVVTINIASLGVGVSSATLYIRNTTPSPGSTLGPRFARVTAIVGSWT